MIRIDLHNYEEFVTDYLDGTLSPGDREAFDHFLSENELIKLQLQDLLQYTFVSETLSFPSKNSLKKPENLIRETNFNEYSVLYLDKELDYTEQVLFRDYLKEHPEKSKDLFLLEKTIIHPDKTIIFPRKQGLKHFTLPLYKKVMYTVASAAAIILLALLVFSPSNNNGNPLNLSVYFPLDNLNNLAAASNIIPERLDDKTEKRSSPVIINSNNAVISNIPAFSENIHSIDSSALKTFDVHTSESIPSLGIAEIFHDEVNGCISITTEYTFFVPESTDIQHMVAENSSAYISRNLVFRDSTVINTLLNNIRSIILNEESPNRGEKAWVFADLSFKALREITGRNLHVKPVYDSTGRLQAFDFQGINPIP